MCYSRVHTKKLSTRVNNYVLCSWYLARTKMITWLSTQRSWGQRSNANSLKTPLVCVCVQAWLCKREPWNLQIFVEIWNLKTQHPLLLHMLSSFGDHVTENLTVLVLCPDPPCTCEKEGLVFWAIFLVKWGGVAPRSERSNQIAERIIIGRRQSSTRSSFTNRRHRL